MRKNYQQGWLFSISSNYNPTEWNNPLGLLFCEERNTSLTLPASSGSWQSEQQWKLNCLRRANWWGKNELPGYAIYKKRLEDWRIFLMVCTIWTFNHIKWWRTVFTIWKLYSFLYQLSPLFFVLLKYRVRAFDAGRWPTNSNSLFQVVSLVAL